MVSYLAGEGARILAQGCSANPAVPHPNVGYLFFDLDKQENVENFIMKIRDFNPDTILHCLGGGFKRSTDLISKKDFLYLLNLNFMVAVQLNNVFIPEMLKTGRGWIIHFGSIASRELTASVGYTCVKSIIVPYVKHMGRKFVDKGVFVTGVTLGALSGSGGALDRLSVDRRDIYDAFIDNRRPTRRATPTAEIMPFIKLLLTSSAKIHASNVICLDEAEGIAI
jgi:short-subunit dehydrogenase